MYLTNEGTSLYIAPRPSQSQREWFSSGRTFMGFITPPHSWYETDDDILVIVKVQGVPRCTFDIFASSCYIKVNAPPFLFSCDLEGEIDETRCVATIDHEGVKLHCAKAKSGLRWHRLARERSTYSNVANALRRRLSIQAARERVDADMSHPSYGSRRTGSADTGKQWQMDKKRHNIIEDRQVAELAVERDRIRAWQSGTGSDRFASNHSHEEDSYDNLSHCSDPDTNAQQSQLGPSQITRRTVDVLDSVDIIHASKPSSEHITGHTHLQAKTHQRENHPFATLKLKKHYEHVVHQKVNTDRYPGLGNTAPPPRTPVNIHVDFTQLETEMPARETRESEIRQWKQGFRSRPDQQHSIADREPLFLKERGDIFFRAGNYQSAINVYTLAITAEKQQVKRFNENLVHLYANRAASHMKVRRCHAAVVDCTAALYLLKANQVDMHVRQPQRLKLRVRRAKAFVLIRQLQLAEHDASCAHELNQESGIIFPDLEEIRRCSSPLGASDLKALGDNRYLFGNISGAARVYGLVLRLRGRRYSAIRTAALTNRAVCHLRLRDYCSAHRDCQRALNLLLRDGTDCVHEKNKISVCVNGVYLQEIRSLELLAKLLHFRGAAAAHMRKYDRAVVDFTSAASITIPKPSEALSSEARALGDIPPTIAADVTRAEGLKLLL